MKILLVVVLALPAALGIDCAGMADGNYEIGCKSYVVCTNGQSQIIECLTHEVYDASTGHCNNDTLVSPPCGLRKDCSTLEDGLYPDTDNSCHSYYTCSGGTYFGHNYCAGLLVFNSNLQTCDWPDHTDPPCGTKGTGTTTRP